jgi:hypothetical protein
MVRREGEQGIGRLVIYDPSASLRTSLRFAIFDLRLITSLWRNPCQKMLKTVKNCQKLSKIITKL